MNVIKLLLGAVILFLGAFSWTWFLRNASRKSVLQQAKLYRDFPNWMHIICNTTLVLIGFYIYPMEQYSAILPIIVGIVIGLYVSRA